MAQKAIGFLEELQTSHPNLSADLQELSRLYQRKLWHQLTLKLDSCFQQPDFNTADTPVQLYQHFISEFGHKINLLKLAHFAVHASKHTSSPVQAREFLQSVIQKLEEMKNPKGSQQPLVLLKMHVAQHHLEAGAIQGEALATTVCNRSVVIEAGCCILCSAFSLLFLFINGTQDHGVQDLWSAVGVMSHVGSTTCLHRTCLVLGHPHLFISPLFYNCAVEHRRKPLTATHFAMTRLQSN